MKLKVQQDSDAESPREWDNLGHMVCWHSRYKLGDGQPDQSPDEWREENPDERMICILPLYLYDHSGITISTSPFSCPWDSGQVGWIYCTQEDLDRCGTPPDRAKEVLRGEVEVYDQFLRGDVYGYVLENDDGEHVDSCWGFFGLDFDNGMADHIDEEHHPLLREALASPTY